MVNYTNEQSSLAVFMYNNKLVLRGAVSHGIGPVVLMKMMEKRNTK